MSKNKMALIMDRNARVRVLLIAEIEVIGYTIVVPANVCFGGVSMQLDLKIDQKTLAAASDISKAVEEAVSTHFSSASGTTTVCTPSGGGGSAATTRRVVRVPSSQSQFSFSISESTAINGTRMDCGCSNSSSQIMAAGESREQVNEVCSSTVDSSPLCDTASSPIQIDAPSTSASQSVSQTDFPHDDQRPSSSAGIQVVFCDNEVHSSVEDCGEPSASTSNFTSGGTVQSQSPTTSSMEGTSPSPQTTTAPLKRRRDKSTPPSHFCEQNDPGGKGQCRQRAILSYRYCIRHILLDPNAPYRQCQHKRKPKSKKDTNLYCTNAIRNDKDTVYCSTHMIMNGMMEPKRKKTSNGLMPSEVAPSVPDPDPSSAIVTWSSAVDGVQQQSVPQTPLQPLPSIMHCGFEQSQRRIGEEADRWIVDSVGSVNSPMINSDAPSVETFPVKDTGMQPFEAVANTAVYPVPPPPIVVQQATPTPLMQRNASCPPSVPTSSNISSASFEEPYSIPSNTPQVMDDSPCSSSMLSPSPVKHLMTTAQQPHPMQQSCSTANLTKQHPQLAAKLLQTPSVSSGSYTMPTAPLSGPIPVGAPQLPAATTTIPTGLAPIPIGAGPVPVGAAAVATPVPVVASPVGQTTIVTRPEFVRNANVASPVPPQNTILPWSAPLLLQRPPSTGVPKLYSLDDLDDEEVVTRSPPPPKKKVIRLKQKRQRMKMVGAYRKIPAVDQMCKMLEDADFDRTDLFPLGLEPSDDESSESDCDIMQQWPTPMERRSDESRSSGAIEVYLLKKQLRLDRHTLLRQAQLNAPVMLASKKYPTSAGAALADRASRCGAKPPSLLRRCTHVITNGCGETVRCMETCLPMSNHCPQHVLYNIHQKLFSYCSESCCGQPVLCVDSMFTSGLCRYHYELSRKDAGMGVAEHESELQPPRPGGIPPISFLQQPQPEPCASTSTMVPPPPYTPLQRDTQMCVYNADMTTGVTNIQRNPEPGHIADFNESEGVETDVSLASVAKELGFDGRELSDMLADLPADETDAEDILHDHFSQGMKEDEVVTTAEMDDLGHSWADVEQFLLSEGYPVDLTPPPFANVDSPNSGQTQTASATAATHSAGTPACFTSPSPTTTSIAQPPRAQSIPTAESLLPHRS
uniref:KAT8 regulatory NSL complex subunit 2 n=1 Tax=Ascaris lumbricoides TaxID=6252 RepID=A0A0M3HRA2_ASCLU